VDPDLDRPQWNAKERSDLLAALVGPVPEKQDELLVGGEFGYLAGDVEPLVQVCERIVLRSWVPGVWQELRDGPVQDPQRLAAGDRPDPRLGLACAGARVAPCAHNGLLRRILGEVGVEQAARFSDR
jgi:hypothetical protein